jgi:hypothetical protein
VALERDPEKVASMTGFPWLTRINLNALRCARPSLGDWEEVITSLEFLIGTQRVSKSRPAKCADSRNRDGVSEGRDYRAGT